ncbi:hypothetical protein IJ847_01035 [Candidatus Saccharibacteria bacterium]|nr:hypothetical protein [Candidatus Saccharibacteria bacterium]
MYKIYEVKPGNLFRETASTIRRLIRPDCEDEILTFRSENGDGILIDDTVETASYVVIGIDDMRSMLATRNSELIQSLEREFCRPDIGVEYETYRNSPLGELIEAAIPYERLRAMVYFYVRYGGNYDKDLGVEPKFAPDADDLLLREMRLLAT